MIASRQQWSRTPLHQRQAEISAYIRWLVAFLKRTPSIEDWTRNYPAYKNEQGGGYLPSAHHACRNFDLFSWNALLLHLGLEIKKNGFKKQNDEDYPQPLYHAGGYWFSGWYTTTDNPHETFTL